MMIAERIQALVHALDVGHARRLNYAALTVMVLGLAVWYDLHCYRNFNSPEAMDAAQVGRHIAEGQGFTTDYIRPFSCFLLRKHNHGIGPNPAQGTNFVDYAEVYGPHPDLANPPLYPLVLAGLSKVDMADWKVDFDALFWSEGHRFVRYAPEFFIALFNQLLLLAVVLLTFRVARTLFDRTTAWLSAVLVLGSDLLWRTSVSGLPTLLLMVIFLGIIWYLTSFTAQENAPNTNQRRHFAFALAVGVLAGAGMLTRYSFGWIIAPIVTFFAVFGGPRKIGLAVASVLACLLVVLPWIIRNYLVSGTYFGTAGYAVVEASPVFPDSRLIQSTNPAMVFAYQIDPYLIKLQANLRLLLQNDVPRLGGGWIAILFFAGLLVGLKNLMAQRLRFFTMTCLGTFLIVAALGRTHLSDVSEMNTENPMVLLTPMVVIFGVGFFVILLNQMNVPSLMVRYAVIALVMALACQPLIMSLLPPRTSPSAYPPYYPPEIQRVSGWMKPSELIMSDIPWAVAWYGHRPCASLTINSDYEFFQFYDYVKHVDGLYLTLNTVDAKLFTECLQAGADTWGSFVFERIGVEKIRKPGTTELWSNVVFRDIAPAPGTRPFPLTAAPSDLSTGLFLTDYIRW